MNSFATPYSLLRRGHPVLRAPPSSMTSGYGCHRERPGGTCSGRSSHSLLLVPCLLTCRTSPHRDLALRRRLTTSGPEGHVGPKGSGPVLRACDEAVMVRWRTRPRDGA